MSSERAAPHGPARHGPGTIAQSPPDQMQTQD